MLLQAISLRTRLIAIGVIFLIGLAMVLFALYVNQAQSTERFVRFEKERAIEPVAQSSDSQAQSVEQVRRDVTELDKVTQSTAAGAEEAAASSEELSAQAADLKQTVADLDGLVRGHQG